MIKEAITYSNNYRYCFNGMEKDDEVAGEGNSYTAQYWQYDSRLCRRWNIDPVVKTHESPYATFANNPIWFADPNGADSIRVNITWSEQKNSDGSSSWLRISDMFKTSYTEDNIAYVTYYLYDKNGNLETAFSSKGFLTDEIASYTYAMEPTEYFVKRVNSKNSWKKAEYPDGTPKKRPLWELIPVSGDVGGSNYRSEVIPGKIYAPTFPLVIETVVDFKAPDKTSFNKNGLVDYYGTILSISAFMNIYQNRNASLAYLSSIYITGFHSYHNGGGQFSDKENDNLAINRMINTTAYMNSIYPSYSYISTWRGYNNYPYRRATIYTHIGRANGVIYRFNLKPH